VVLHQEGGTPEGVAAETALQDLRARGATLAYPAGLDQSWDAGACCTPSKQQGADDIAFLDALFKDLPRQTPVDGTRRAMVGYSSGGMLTYRYVCGRPGKLDAAVVVSGSLETECADGITTPDVMAVHGKKDGTIGFHSPIFIDALGLAPRPVEDSLDLFTRSAGCEEPQHDRRPDLEVRRWADCRGGSVEAQLVEQKGHGWVKLDATRRTREFLVAHLLERSPR
jgi:polyhydroxybutyrate depolymerase